ncbi:MAG: hypothetical protein KBS52_01440 [Clostridiales bacterium]|nr:hypothetical protein [Candidatus Equinaster intestinalis]
MKKITALFLCVTVLFSLTACSKAEKSQTVSEESDTASVSSKGADSVIRPASENKGAENLGELFIVNKNDDFKINGIILVGAKHVEEYGADFKVEDLEFATGKLNKDFYLDESIEIYMDGEYLSGSKHYAEIFITKHNEDIMNMTASDMKEKAVSFSGELLYITASKQSLALEANISSEKNSPGLYDIVFTAGDRVCYCVTVNVSKK